MQRVEARDELGVVVAVGGVYRLVVEVGAEVVQRFAVRPFFFGEVAAHRFAEAVVVQLGAADAENGEFFRQLVVFEEVIQRGDEFAPGEVAGSAKDDDAVVFGSHGNPGR